MSLTRPCLSHVRHLSFRCWCWQDVLHTYQHAYYSGHNYSLVYSLGLIWPMAFENMHLSHFGYWHSPLNIVLALLNWFFLFRFIYYKYYYYYFPNLLVLLSFCLSKSECWGSKWDMCISLEAINVNSPFVYQFYPSSWFVALLVVSFVFIFVTCQGTMHAIIEFWRHLLDTTQLVKSSRKSWLIH